MQLDRVFKKNKFEKSEHQATIDSLEIIESKQPSIFSVMEILKQSTNRLINVIAEKDICESNFQELKKINGQLEQHQLKKAQQDGYQRQSLIKAKKQHKNQQKIIKNQTSQINGLNEKQLMPDCLCIDKNHFKEENFALNSKIEDFEKNEIALKSKIEDSEKNEIALKSKINDYEKNEIALKSNIDDYEMNEIALKSKINDFEKNELALKQKIKDENDKEKEQSVSEKFQQIEHQKKLLSDNFENLLEDHEQLKSISLKEKESSALLKKENELMHERIIPNLELKIELLEKNCQRSEALLENEKRDKIDPKSENFYKNKLIDLQNEKRLYENACEKLESLLICEKSYTSSLQKENAKLLVIPQLESQVNFLEGLLDNERSNLLSTRQEIVNYEEKIKQYQERSTCMLKDENNNRKLLKNERDLNVSQIKSSESVKNILESKITILETENFTLKSLLNYEVNSPKFLSPIFEKRRLPSNFDSEISPKTDLFNQKEITRQRTADSKDNSISFENNSFSLLEIDKDVFDKIIENINIANFEINKLKEIEKNYDVLLKDNKRILENVLENKDHDILKQSVKIDVLSIDLKRIPYQETKINALKEKCDGYKKKMADKDTQIQKERENGHNLQLTLQTVSLDFRRLESFFESSRKKI